MNITPEHVFTMNRREVLKLLGLATAAALLPWEGAEAASTSLTTTPESIATSYNNFYEFGQSKTAPAANSKNFDTTGWRIHIDGLVKNPMSLSIAEMISRFGQVERTYRMRCVEGWSMVIPWQGFELRKLLEEARPEENAKFVAFESYADPKQMPAVGSGSFPFPYREGLRLDEALFPLTIMATGAYGKALSAPSGAPIRLVVPWKYGFKSLKSVVKITLTEQQPRTTWDSYNPREYGFYSNVNPGVPHRRWSQSTERFIGQGGLRNVTRQPTLLFNGYDEVAPLYAGMDLNISY